MSRIIEQICNLENLYWAWDKAKYFYRPGDIWFDEIEVAKFEANIDEELNKIKKQIESKEYITSPIKPVGFPKSLDPDNNTPRIRQTFWIPVRDQVTWLSVVNIIGPLLDRQMPFWSYGNRLYISVFYKKDKVTGKDEIKFGPYRHTAKYTYRKWNQSWPLYRRHIAITAKIMAKQEKFKKYINNFKIEELEDDRERDLLEQNKFYPNNLKVAYLNRDYWKNKLSNKVYWAGIDLKQFYPNITSDVIKENYQNYFPIENQSDELEQLLSNLLKFPLDSSGWSTEELKYIEIDQQQNIFDKIPTGLFVAGFLANVALLDIDKKVNDKLKKRRNIVHFRFVDDHVILADNYECLTDWISWYRKVLKENIGIEINKNKVEPKSLRERLRTDDENNPNSVEQLDRDAKKETELDTDFPSPLMTQTLAKVSQIVQTNFELLDEAEEEQLISDIEHLLVTDFPDQELRKETRISFAANMLARLAPEKQSDINGLFLIEEELNQLEEEKRKNKDNKLKQKYKNLISSLKQKRKKEEINLKIKELSERRHTLNLLLKAIRENHDKVRLWTKICEYCRRAGEEDIGIIFDLIEQLEGKEKIHELSVGFIYSLITQVLSHQVIFAYHIYVDPKSSFIQKDRAGRFLKGILRPRILQRIVFDNVSKFYHTKTIDLFQVTLGSIIYLLIEEIKDNRIINIKKYLNLIERFNIIDWNNPQKFISTTEYSLGNWTWWITQETSDSSSNVPNMLWKLAIKRLSLKDSIAWSNIALYPKELSVEVIRKFDRKLYTKLGKEEGWWYDVFEGIEQDKSVCYSNKYLKRMKSLKRKKSYKEYISLYDWVRWTKQIFNKTLEKVNEVHGSFDPRVSEWTALEIVRQIAKELDDKISYIYIKNPSDIKKMSFNEKTLSIKIHPFNYLLPKEWSNDNNILTWEEWKRKIGDTKEKLKLRDEADWIHDSRYTPVIENQYNKPDIYLSIINGLGVILLGLLVRSFDLPAIWNPSGLQRIRSGLVNKRISDYPVSSRTLGIIKGCFSKRNRETPLISEFQRLAIFAHEDDTTFDPPKIFTIVDLINLIGIAQKTLEKYQLTVQDHQPRQLIPINFIQLSREYDPYIEKDDDQRI